MILAIDTTGSSLNVALGDTEGTLIGSSFDELGNSTEQLPLIVLELFKEHGYSFRSLTKIIVAVGPGSFTGIRSGISFAQGLASAQAIPLLGLDILTAGFLLGLSSRSDPGLVHTALRANKLEFFIRSFTLNSTSLIESVSEIDTVSEETLLKMRSENEVIDLGEESLSESCSEGLFYSFFRKEPAITALFQNSTNSPLIPRYVKGASALTLAERNQPKN